MKRLLAILIFAVSADALACVDLPFTASLDHDSSAQYRCVNPKTKATWMVYFDDQAVDLKSQNNNLVQWSQPGDTLTLFNWFKYQNVRSQESLISHYSARLFTESSGNAGMVYSKNIDFIASNSGVWFRPFVKDADFRVGVCYYNRVSMYVFDQPNQNSPSWARHIEFSPDFKSMIYAVETANQGITEQLNCTLAQ